MRQCRYPVALWGLVALLLVVAARPAHARGNTKLGDSTQVSPAQLRAMLLHRPHGASSPAETNTRSVLLASGLSAAVPGLGQAYNRQWIKATVGLALEAALITGYVAWRQRGLDGVDAYQAEAHRLWNPARYGRWINSYKAFLQEEDGATINTAAVNVEQVEGINFQAPGSWSRQERQQVRAFFNEVRSLEDHLYHQQTGAAFSHHLPYHGNQQYYELIGKYFQYAPGWNDYGGGEETPWLDEDGNFTRYIEPEEQDAEGQKVNVSDRFFDYAEDHAQANTLLRRASRVTVFLLANHFLATLDAAISAKLHNRHVQTRMQLGRGVYGQARPMASLRVRF